MLHNLLSIRFFLSFCFANMAVLVFLLSILQSFSARIYRCLISLMSKKDVLVEIGFVLLP